MNIKFTPVRVVCHNTLTMAVREGEKPIRVPHTRDIRERLRFARASLEIIEATYRQIEQDFAAMAEVTLDDKQHRKNNFYAAVFCLS